MFDMSDSAVWGRSCQWINTTAKHNPALKTIMGQVTSLNLPAALAVIRTNDSFEDALAAASTRNTAAVETCVGKLVVRKAIENGVDLSLYPPADQQKLERIICWLVDCCVNDA